MGYTIVSVKRLILISSLTFVIHWWMNESPEKAKTLVVDIVPEETG